MWDPVTLWWVSVCSKSLLLDATSIYFGVLTSNILYIHTTKWHNSLQLVRVTDGQSPVSWTALLALLGSLNVYWYTSFHQPPIICMQVSGILACITEVVAPMQKLWVSKYCTSKLSSASRDFKCCTELMSSKTLAFLCYKKWSYLTDSYG